jgi:hypothetical protein
MHFYPTTERESGGSPSVLRTDREEQPGYAPFTVAAEIAALLVATLAPAVIHWSFDGWRTVLTLLDRYLPLILRMRRGWVFPPHALQPQTRAIIMPTDRREHPSTAPTRPPSAIPALLRRTEFKYREMPRLRLTQAQTPRVRDLDTMTSRAVLAILTAQGVLKRTPADTFVRPRDQRRARIWSGRGR